MTFHGNGADRANHVTRRIHAFRITRSFARRGTIAPGWYANVTLGERCIYDHAGPHRTRHDAITHATKLRTP